MTQSKSGSGTAARGGGVAWGAAGTLAAMVLAAGGVMVAGAAEPLSLAGGWQVRLDEEDQGVGGRWYAAPLVGERAMDLPGSLAAAGLGHPFDPATGRYGPLRRPYVKWPAAGYTDATRADELGALVPARLFLGPAWFERTVDVPAAWAGRPLRLTLERVKWTSRLWVDGREVRGIGADSLHAPHRYEFPVPADAGRRLRLTLRVDNRPPLNLGLAGHGYGMETEPLWHGVAGTMLLEPLAPARIESARVVYQAAGRVLRCELTGVATAGPPGDVRVAAVLTPEGGAGPVVRGEPVAVRFADPAPGRTGPFQATIRLALPAGVAEWDEFRPQLQQLELALFAGGGEPVDTARRRIGLRELRRDGRQLRLNGIPLFLRGNLDCAIHPESEAPPTDRGWWLRVLGIHKAAGFNHLRFHTWCPPAAAFEVADELGLYLQVETAYWVDNWIHATEPHPPRIGEDAAVDRWVLAEARRILRAHGHHPSFAMLCLGNEFGAGSDWGKIDAIVAELQQESGSVLVAGTTARRSGPHDQFWVTHHSGAAARGLGPPHSDWDFAPAVTATDKPVVAHETGQRQSWPDYDALLPAFTGVPQPHNLTMLRARAGAAGITDHRARCEASVRFAHRLYQHEHEALRRTPGLAGYQLLMLHDFTGQGEAHVGLLDPFFREKPGISLAAIRRWNGPTVPLARLPAYVWTTGQALAATFQLAHQGPGELRAAPTWELHDRSRGVQLAGGTLPPVAAAPGTLADLGRVSVPLGAVAAPARLELVLHVGPHSNSWPLWVYQEPAGAPAPPAPAPVTHHRLTAAALADLAAGRTVLLLFHRASGPRFRQTRWESTYWTGAWGWGSGLGLLCDPAHPALAGFPNDGHSDWQWRDLAEDGTCIALDPAHAAAATIVEHLSTFHRPAREAFVLEWRVGAGRLLACGFDLGRDLARRPAARALRDSLLDYCGSSNFRPALVLDPAAAAAMFAAAEPLAATARADSEAPGHEAARAIDGDPATMWHTRWGAIEPPHPHELVIEFEQPRMLQGVRLKPRADQDNGRPAEVSLFLAERAGEWGEPLIERAPLPNDPAWQTLAFPPRTGRLLRLVIHREVAGRPFASLAELVPVATVPP